MNRDTLYLLASKSFAGLTEFAAALAIAHCTPAQLTASITDATTKRQLYKSARAGKGQAYIDLRSARATASLFCGQARDYLKPKLGPTFSALWAEIGFEGQNLEVPLRDGKRLSLLDGFKAYFLAHIAEESATFNITALRAQVLRDALASGVQTTTNCKFDTRSKRDAQDAAEATLLKKLRCFWTELESILDPLDPRWLKFIDRIPGDPRAPEQVDEVSASAQLGGVITLNWEDTERVARYKVFKQVVGVDAELVLAETVEDSDAQLTGLIAGTTVKLQIVATNSVGDAPASEVIELQAA